MHKYKLVIWDIDGTLLDTHEGVSNALRYALKQFKIEKSSQDILAMVHTPKIKEAFIKIAGMDEEIAKEATDIFRNYYVSKTLLQAAPYQGILDVINTCAKKGIKQAIATNKRQDCATKICHHFGIDKFCNLINGGDRYNSLSKADLIKKSLNYYQILDLSSAVMIGDTESDKKAAKEAGIDFIGVNYGFGFHDVPEYANKPIDILQKLGIE